MSRKVSAALIGALVVAANVVAQPAFSAKTVYTGEICDFRVHKLSTQINWHKNLKDAEAEAQADGKLIFWMHMLGRIDGGT